MNKNNSYNCFVCSADFKKIVERKDKYTHYKCEKCALVTIFPQPEDKIISEYYDGFLFKKPEDNEISSRKKIIDKDVDLIAKDIKNIKKENNLSLLDFGGGTGFYANSFYQHGYKVTLLDLDKQACKYVKSKFPEINVICTNPMLNAINKKFDIIFCNQVIEHYKDSDKLLNTLHSLLNDNGLLIITTPNQQCREYWFRPTWVWDYIKLTSDNFLQRIKNTFKLLSDSWLCCDPPRHIYAFNKKNLSKLHKRNKLEVISVFTEYVTTQNYSLKQHRDFSFKRIQSVLKIIFNIYANLGISLLKFLDRKNNWGNNLVIFSSKEVKK